MGTHTALDEMRAATTLLAGIRSADDLTVTANRDGGARTVRLLAEAAFAAGDGADQLTAIAAIHALAQIFDESADDALVALLGDGRAFAREHAAWAFSARLPRLEAIAPMIGMVIEGGFVGMIAQRTLEQWSALAADHLALALEGALIGITGADARERLIETLGLVPGRIAERLIRHVALDSSEASPVRVAAIASLGDRPADASVLELLEGVAIRSPHLAPAAQLALHDVLGTPTTSTPPTGLTVAQLFLHADIDRQLSQVGSGDNGGIATLLVRVGDALVANRTAAVDTLADGTVAADPGEALADHGLDRGELESGTVSRVLTMSRGTYAQALTSLEVLADEGHVYAPLPFAGPPVSLPTAWPRRIQAQRGIRRVLKAAGRVDAIHLRMADVGTLAAHTVARELGIPVVFTVAPDPHTAIQSLDTAGELRRDNFGDADSQAHYWFRVRLVQRMAADAAHTVLFPRHDLETVMRDLVGIDVTSHPELRSVIAEGIDLGVIERSRVLALAASVDPDYPGDDGRPAFSRLDAVLGQLPEHRRSLPLAIAVGRVNPVKGTATLVETWVADPAVRARCNLLIVGGDLENPTTEEASQLTRIDAAIPRDRAASEGLLLAGHQGNDVVGHWLAATRFGRPGLAAPHGVYVCASVKEEFGIAILEAMATGLTVVAPDSGGPATYVEHEVTGFLVDTTDPAALANAITRALELASGPMAFEYAELASDMVTANFAIEAMAVSLAAVYRQAAAGADAGTFDSFDWALSG